MSSTFDASAFENMTTDQANETTMTPVPEGEYLGLIDRIRIKSIKIRNGERAGQEVPILEVIYKIMDDTGELGKQLNRENVTVRQDVWLDVNDQGGLAFGPNQNVALGRLREAVGLNAPGKPFAFKQLEGQGPLKIMVTNRSDEETGNVFDGVSRVMRPE